jgi:hypothetical protein
MAGPAPTCMLLLPFLLCACDLFSTGTPPNRCERAEDVVRDAYTRACEGQADACCFCRCWSDGRKEYDQAQYRADGTCECLNAKEDRSCLCEDQRLTVAEKCLQDQEACQTEAADFISGESGLCTLTPIH